MKVSDEKWNDVKGVEDGIARFFGGSATARQQTCAPLGPESVRGVDRRNATLSWWRRR
jgi:hypothetical protein